MKWSVDDTDDGTVVDDEADGDAEHGEDVGVVYGSLDSQSVSIHFSSFLFIEFTYRLAGQCTMLVARQ